LLLRVHSVSGGNPVRDVKDTPIIRGVRNYLEGMLAQKQMVREIHPSLSGEANGKLRNTHGRIS
jgi:hypothetical protein